MSEEDLENLSVIEVQPSLPLPQQYEIRNTHEDWTGKSDKVLRRKLQNRLNQRARSKHIPYAETCDT